MIEGARLVQSSEVIRIQALRFELLRSEESRHAAMKRITAGLGYNLHHSAGALSVLRFISTGLYLDFFHERKIDARGKRPINARVNTDTTERAVSNVHAVSYVLVFQSAT